MDVIETQMQRTSPILRVTTDISEFKSRGSKEDIRAPETSRSRNSGEANLRHASNLLLKKKQLRPLFSSPNPYRSSSYYASNAYSIHPNSKSNVSTFTQRIMSAKLLRVKQLQNELKDTQIQLHEAKNENRILKTLQKRQDNALKKYEGDQAQLPQLIKSHNEELRVITTQYKQLKANYRELELKLRQRETELDELKEQHRHLVKLSRDRHLGHREKLSKQVEDLKETVREQNERIQVLTRRVELEGKNYKHQLNVEMTRHKETQLELAMAHESIESLKNLIEAKDKYINNAVPNRFYKLAGNTGVAQVFSTSNTRFRNIPKTAGHVSLQSKRDSEETINSTNFDQSGQDTDETSELSSNNPTLKDVQNKVKLNSCNLNLRKKLSNRKLLMKSNQAKLNLISKEEQKNDKNNDDTDTPHYSSSLPSINNSVENSKYNSSESDTLTKMSSIKTKRRVSIDSGHTVISDNTSPNNEGNDFDYDDIVNNKDVDKDDHVYHNGVIDCNDIRNSSNSSDCKTHYKEERSKKKILRNKQMNKKEKLRRNSVPSLESDGPLESITDSLIKAQNDDRLLRQKSIKDELKELEKRLKQNNQKFMLERNTSFESLFNQKAQSVKDELKEFEEQLINSCELKSYSSSVSKTFEEEADKIVKNVTNTMHILHDENDVDGNKSDSNDNDESEDNARKKFGLKDISLSWNAMRDEFQRDKEQTESILDEFYNNMTKIKNDDDNKFEDNNDNFEDVSEDDEDSNGKADVKLDEEEKAKLLKALSRIDREETGGKGSAYSSSDCDIKDQRNSFNLNYKFDLNSADNLNNIKSSYDYEFPKIKNVEGQFTKEFDNVKSKTDLMDELFGNSHPFKSQQESTKNVGNT